MGRAYKTDAIEPHRQIGAERTPASGLRRAALTDESPALVPQRKLADTIRQGPRVAAQRAADSAIHDSPRVVAQRAQLARAGEHLLAHEVAHTLQQGAGSAAAQRREVSNPGDALEVEADIAADAMTTGRPASVSAGSSVARIIQRKVGFELEDRDWRAYIQEGKDIRPAKRQENLYEGPGFDLEADDSLGPKLPSLEFVTVPFELTDKGIGDLNTAFSLIRRITARIGEYAPIKNPFEIEDEKPKAKKFLQKHGLKDNVLLAGGTPDAKFKMQATQGVSLEDLPTVMRTFGSNAPHESVLAEGERAPAREFMYGERKQASGKDQAASDLFAAAPSLAEDVIAELRASISPHEKTQKVKKEKKKEKRSKDKARIESRTVSEKEDDRVASGTTEEIEAQPEKKQSLEAKSELQPAPESKVQAEPQPDITPKPERKAPREHKSKREHKHKHVSTELLPRAESPKELLIPIEEINVTKRDPLGNTGRLLGFLSVVMLYVKLLSTLNPGGKQAKYMIPFLARTSFPALFALLPEEQQQLLRDHFDALLRAIVAVANAKQFIVTERLDPETLTQQKVLHDSGFGPDIPLVRHPDFGLTGLTLGKWLGGVILKGVEYLNPAGITRFLEKDSKIASNALESFAVLGRKSIEPSMVTDDEDIKGHSRLGIFENRMIAGPKGFFTATMAHGAALSYLTYYKNLKENMGAPGMFPSKPSPELEGKLEKKEGKKKEKEKGKGTQ